MSGGTTIRRRWFGTDGIRGPAGRGPLEPEFLTRLGVALGERAGRGGQVLIARDTRESGPAIVAALARGLAAAGARARDLGVLPTAGLPLAMRERGAPLGLVVSASHNPWEDNGVKVFGPGGLKLADEAEAELETRLEALVEATPPTPAPAPEPEDGAAAYQAWMTRRFAGLDLSRFSLLVDCANGSASWVAPAVLGALGARVTAVHDRPDGRNINAGCGSTHVDVLARAMTAGRHDAGLAFDGDADRVLMADRRGRACDGDAMLGYLALWLAGRGQLPGRAVVATVMSNLGLERALAADEVGLVRCPVGDRHVLAAMRGGGYALGGEASGHLLFLDGGHYIGDGLYTALRLMEALQDTGHELTAVIDTVPRVPQVLHNVPVSARPPLAALPRLQARSEALAEQYGDELRIVLRYSGTENLARVMVEGLDGELVESLARELGELWVAEIEAGERPER
jgi:phosphoglucosamine mutase